jgi:hypothetical protein
MAYPKTQWDNAMIDALKKLRAQGASTLECADRIGVCLRAAQKKCRELGISHRMNRGNTSGRDNRV